MCSYCIVVRMSKRLHCSIYLTMLHHLSHIFGLLWTISYSPLSANFRINNKTVTDKSVIAHKFNEYFVNVDPTFSEKIQPTDTNFSAYLKGDYLNSFMLFSTTPGEIIQVVNQMQAKQSAGFDDIPLDIMKLSTS